ncbi:MAG: hydrogenase maturation protease [Gemmataceae bacterium]
MSVLLVGVGNTLRRDDGAGAAVVNHFAGHHGCRVRVVHQLLPELVEELARCGRVVFVDAAVNRTEVQLVRLSPSARLPGVGHTGDPGWLLGLCEALHGRSPEGWLLAVPAFELGFGEGLSAATAAAVGAAERVLRDHITK